MYLVWPDMAYMERTADGQLTALLSQKNSKVHVMVKTFIVFIKNKLHKYARKLGSDFVHSALTMKEFFFP